MSQKRPDDRYAFQQEPFAINYDDDDDFGQSQHLFDDFEINSKPHRLEGVMKENDFALKQPMQVEKVKRKLFSDDVDKVLATPRTEKIPERSFSCKLRFHHYLYCTKFPCCKGS